MHYQEEKYSVEMAETDENDIPLNLVEEPSVQHVKVRAIEESIILQGKGDNVADVQIQQFSDYFSRFPSFSFIFFNQSYHHIGRVSSCLQRERFPILGLLSYYVDFALSSPKYAI